MSADDDLLALIAQAPAVTQASDELPDLDLTLFLSPSAQREIQAAQGYLPTLPPTAEPLGDLDALTSLWEEGNQAMDQDIRGMFDEPPPVTITATDAHLNQIWGGIERESAEAQETAAASRPAVEPDLAGLFMTGEAVQAMAALGQDPPSLPALSYVDFDFTTEDMDIDLEAPRNHRMASPRPAPRYTPHQGVVVRQRTDAGFRPTLTPGDAQRMWETRTASTAEARPGRPSPASVPAPPTGPRQTLMQHILADD